MTLLKLYHQKVAAKEIVSDAEQLKALHYLSAIQQAVVKKTFFRKSIHGLYLWGSVGVGKTLLMDLLCDSLPAHKVCRIHFHQFMHRVQVELRALQGHRDPLKIIAKKMAREFSLLCFDEFYVSDIGDAMLLGELLKTLIDCRVCVVFTSNSAPDDLYKDGLQRDRFLPAIALIKKYALVFHFNSVVDYRLRHLEEEGLFYSPLNAHAQLQMENAFEFFSKNDSWSHEPIFLYDRSIAVVRRSREVVWFNFAAICHVPRSQEDYLALAKTYSVFLVGDIPVLGPEKAHAIANFIKLIDVLYDAKKIIVLSSEKTLEELRVNLQGISGFARTHSRLIEMQSPYYFEK